MSGTTSPPPEDALAPRGRHDATRGSLSRSVLVLAVPILGVTLLETTRSAIELKFLGVLGPTAIDAVITVNQSFHQLFMTFVIATAWGASAVVAQRIGARDPWDAGQTMGQALGLICAFGIMAALAANTLSGAILGGIGMAPDEQAQAVAYLRLTGIVVIAPFVAFGLSTTLQAVGDVMTPLFMVVLSTMTNILCNWLFIFGPGPFPALGPVGVAVAQLCSGGIAVAFGLYRLRRLHPDLGVHLRSILVRDWGKIGRISRLALPVWLQILCRAVGIILILRLAGRYGATARAGYGVGMRLDAMLINVGLAFSGAAATITGQNVGARRLRRAAAGPWVAWMYYAGILLCFTGLFWWKAEAVLRVFTTDPNVVGVGADFLRITSAVYLFFAAAFVFSRAMQGAGDMWRPTLITVVTTFAVFVPLALWLPSATGLGVRAVFAASAASIVVGGILQAWFFVRGGWRSLAV